LRQIASFASDLYLFRLELIHRNYFPIHPKCQTVLNSVDISFCPVSK